MSWKDELARARGERDDFRRRASLKRKEWRELKASRRHLEALEAMTRMHEYAASARQRQNFIDENKHRL
jgi:hypothetical protein